jgi:uncharacterized protein YbjT (DUF2867 family)
MGKIFITGATGTNGKALVKKLIERNVDFVVGSRNVEKAQQVLGKDVEVRAFDFSDHSTFESSLAGIEKVFLLGPPLFLKVDELITPFLDFMKEQGVNRIVYFSAFASDKMGSQMDFHVKIEQKLKDDNYDYTILQPSFFSQNFKNYEFENITERNIVFMPAGEGKVGFVDVEDIAAVAVETLISEGHSQKIYQLTGPELLSYFDAASLLSRIVNKEIYYPNPSPDNFKQVLESSGAPEFIGDYLSDVYQIIARNEINVLTDDVFLVTNKKPTALQEVLERDFSK